MTFRRWLLQGGAPLAYHLGLPPLDRMTWMAAITHAHYPRA